MPVDNEPAKDNPSAHDNPQTPAAGRIMRLATSAVDTFDLFTRRRVAVQLLLGFSAGAPIAFSGDLIGAWLADVGIEVTTIALLSAVTIPYALKFAWAPLLDRYDPPVVGRWLGRRRGWILVMQILVGALIAMAGLCNPAVSVWPLAAICLALATAGASQDIVIDAYRTDVLEQEERGPGTSSYVCAYRVALITTGWLGLYLDGKGVPWGAIYALSSMAMVVGVVGTLIAPMPREEQARNPSLGEAVVEPFLQIAARRLGWLMLLFVALVRLPDDTTRALQIPMLKALAFGSTDIANARQLAGVAMAIVGTLVGGGLVARLGMWRSLPVMIVLVGASNVAFAALYYVPTTSMLYAAVSVENFCSGLTSAGFLAFLISQCDRRYSATQFALFTALMQLVGRFSGAAAGYYASVVGWPMFWITTSVLALPALVILPLLPRRDYNAESANHPAPSAFEVLVAEPVETGTQPAKR